MDLLRRAGRAVPRWLRAPLVDVAAALAMVGFMPALGAPPIMNTPATSVRVGIMTPEGLAGLGGVAGYNRQVDLWWWVAAVGLVALPLRHRWPTVSLAATLGMLVGHALNPLSWPSPPHLVAPLAMYSVGRHVASQRRSVTAVVVGTVVALGLLGSGRLGPVLPPAAMLGAWLFGVSLRNRQAYLKEVEARAHDAERERDLRAETAAAGERARISRELHDVVAHGLAVIVIQAQAGERALQRRPEVTRAALRAIADTGRSSLADLRRLLEGVQPAAESLTPLPGIPDLPELAERITAAGVPVTLEVARACEQVPQGVSLSVYRIVQEALTNTLKHAGAQATARVVLDCTATELSICVTDDGGRDRPQPGVAGSGRGLPGMRERAATLGGSITAGARAEGGFQVLVTLPVAAAATTGTAVPSPAVAADGAT